MLRSLALFVLLSLSKPGCAQAPSAAQRVADISYRLQTANLSLCPHPSRAASFQIEDAKSTAVYLVITTGPAAQAGLRAGDTLAKINGAPVTSANVIDLINTALDAPATLTLTLGDGRTLRFDERDGCGFGAGVEASEALDSYADGTNVSVASALVQFAPTDDELALVVAHELAHNYLRHKRRLDAAHVHRGLRGLFDDSARAVRATEEEADVFALYLMAGAGYEIAAAPGFWRRFGAHTGLGVLSDGTHPGTRARIALAERTIAAIRAQHAAHMPLTPPMLPQP